MKTTKAEKKEAFSGQSVAIRDCGADNLFQLILMTVVNGKVVEEQVLTDPDSPSIVIAKAESVLWSIRQGSL